MSKPFFTEKDEKALIDATSELKAMRECEHEPVANLAGDDWVRMICKHCGKKLKAKWFVDGE